MVVTIHSIKIKAAQEKQSRQRIIKSQGTYIPPPGEENNEPDMTVPDQTLSIKQILERHTRGQEVPVLQPFYSNTENWNEYLPDITKLDRFERLELAQRIRDNATEMEQDMLDRAKGKADAKKAEAKQNIENLKKEYDEEKDQQKKV